MIFSSADIKNIIGRDPIFRSLATVKVVDGKPPIEAGNGIFVYIRQYPTVSEFEATWPIWIVDFDNEPVDVLIRQLRSLLPQFTILEEGAIVKASTTELLSTKTETRPSVKQEDLRSDLYGAKFEELAQSIEDRMLLVGPGRSGKDGRNGKDGLPGKDGLDGKDLLATEAELNDLKDVFVPDPGRGQFLMFDGAGWIARHVPQVFSAGGGSSASDGGESSGGGGGGGSSMPEPPSDGRYYVRQVVDGAGQWVDFLTAMNSVLSGGDFDGITLSAGSRGFVATGGSSSLRIVKTIFSDSGSLSISGADSDFLFNRVFKAEPGDFTVQPVVADVDANKVIVGGTASVAIGQSTANFSISRRIVAESASLSAQGQGASFVFTEPVSFFSDWSTQVYGYDSLTYPEWWAE